MINFNIKNGMLHIEDSTNDNEIRLSIASAYKIEANEEKEISFVCSFEENIEEIDVKNLIENEEKRVTQMIEKTGLLKNQKNSKKD